MEPRVFAFGTKIISFQCTFHVIEAISASSLKCLKHERNENAFSTCRKEFNKEEIYTEILTSSTWTSSPNSPLQFASSSLENLNRIRDARTQERRNEGQSPFLDREIGKVLSINRAGEPYLYMNTEPTKRKTTIELNTIDRIAYPGRAGVKENVWWIYKLLKLRETIQAWRWNFSKVWRGFVERIRRIE